MHLRRAVYSVFGSGQFIRRYNITFGCCVKSEQSAHAVRPTACAVKLPFHHKNGKERAVQRNSVGVSLGIVLHAVVSMGPCIFFTFPTVLPFTVQVSPSRFGDLRIRDARQRTRNQPLCSQLLCEARASIHISFPSSSRTI